MTYAPMITLLAVSVCLAVAVLAVAIGSRLS